MNLEISFLKNNLREREMLTNLTVLTLRISLAYQKTLGIIRNILEEEKATCITKKSTSIPIYKELLLKSLTKQQEVDKGAKTSTGTSQKKKFKRPINM